MSSKIRDGKSCQLSMLKTIANRHLPCLSPPHHINPKVKHIGVILRYKNAYARYRSNYNIINVLNFKFFQLNVLSFPSLLVLISLKWLSWSTDTAGWFSLSRTAAFKFFETPYFVYCFLQQIDYFPIKKMYESYINLCNYMTHRIKCMYKVYIYSYRIIFQMRLYI